MFTASPWATKLVSLLRKKWVHWASYSTSLNMICLISKMRLLALFPLLVVSNAQLAIWQCSAKFNMPQKWKRWCNYCWVQWVGLHWFPLFFFIYLFIWEGEKEREKEREREPGTGQRERESILSRLPVQHRARQGSVSWPWDHELSWNLESGAQSSEPRGRPVSFLNLSAMPDGHQFLTKQCDNFWCPFFPDTWLWSILRLCVICFFLLPLAVSDLQGLLRKAPFPCDHSNSGQTDSSAQCPTVNTQEHGVCEKNDQRTEWMMNEGHLHTHLCSFAYGFGLSWTDRQKDKYMDRETEVQMAN